MARKVVIVLYPIFVTCSYPEKVFGTTFWATFFHTWATANFLFKNSHLVTIATGVGLQKISMAALNCAIFITPCLVQHSRFYTLS